MPLRPIVCALLVLHVIAAAATPARAASSPTPSPGSPCAIAPVGADEEFVAVGIGKGTTLTNVVIGAEEYATSIVGVEITPGETPLTLLLGAHYHVIWEFTGAVERIHRLIVVSPDDLGAVKGIAPENVAFVPSTTLRRADGENATRADGELEPSLRPRARSGHLRG